jgi:hypothetical protein
MDTFLFTEGFLSDTERDINTAANNLDTTLEICDLKGKLK